MISIFLSPFLLFVLELMAGKHYLVLFGGSSSVWVTLMLFFTTTLLFGYIYATLAKPKTHYTVLVVALLYCVYLLFSSRSLFPFAFTFQDPTMTVILNACVNMTLFVFILASTSSIVPRWSEHPNPYQYYSLSNLGSLVGLIGYPLLVEPYISFKNQQTIWIVLFVFNILHIANIAKNNFVLKTKQNTRLSLSSLPIIYSTLSTAYFLVTTTAISQTVGSFSLLLALPMAIYLVSFIAGFSFNQLFQLSFHLPTTTLLLLFVILLSTKRFYLGYSNQMMWLLGVQFLVNSLFHTLIYRIRPHKSNLSSYYVSIALGGAIASVLVGVIAPMTLSAFYEFPIVVGLCIVAFTFVAINKFTRIVISYQYVLISVFCLVVTWLAYTQKPFFQPGTTVSQTKIRNFYGFLNIVDITSNGQLNERRLFSGETIHGLQNYNGKQEYEPTMYYNRNTAIGLLFSKPVQNVGVIGLGIGTIAAYCNPGTEVTFYEINHEVINIANQKFTYLSNCTKNGGSIKIIEGDARISLSKGVAKKYDLLIVDAFTDDAIPTHLLTSEAISLYFDHLNKDGILALHVSSKYLDLMPTMVVTANSLGLQTSSYSTSEASYVLLSRVPLTIGNKETPSSYPKIKTWTDDYVNIIQTVKW